MKEKLSFFFLLCKLKIYYIFNFKINKIIFNFNSKNFLFLEILKINKIKNNLIFII